MEESRIYWTGIEFNYSRDSADYGKLKGGFVYGFVHAIDVREALKRFEGRLIEEKLTPKNFEFISIYDLEMEWETEEQTENYFQLAKEAESSSEVMFDAFYSYES